ncbi:MAG: HEAT repeat domain-containing protein [Pseudomonadales bacterium]|nr:HEAT repeat domain-containing protein [Pseudomonadales bacterium]
MNQITLLGRLFTHLGIRPAERSLVALLFGNMFLSGLAMGVLRVCAFTLFLEQFASEQLAINAILLAISGTLITLLIARNTQNLSARGYAFTVLAGILGSLLLVRLLLVGFPNKILIFLLPLFFELIYMLFNLQFIALITRLLNIRQTKRLAGLVRSGEFLAEMVGGASIAILLNFMPIADLLLVAAISTLGVILLVQITVNKFSQKLTDGQLTENAEASANKMLSMLKIPYVGLISICYASFMFAYCFLDVAFYKYAATAYPTEQALAGFIGQFFAVSGGLTLLAMVFAFAPVIRKFGILAGIIGFPIVIAIGTTLVSGLEFMHVNSGLIFVVIVITNGLRFILQSALWRPSTGILFQVLPGHQRAQGTALLEGVIDPLAAGLAGACLYAISTFLNWGPDRFLLVLSVILVLWVVLGFSIRRLYLANLTASIQKRKLGSFSLAQLDKESMEIILRGLCSPYPAEVFYCLDLLEEMDHPEIIQNIQLALQSDNTEVRINVLQRIDRLNVTALAPHVLELVQRENNAEVMGQALRSYAGLAPDDVLKTIKPFLRDRNKPISKGALAGILTFDPTENEALDFLLGLVRAPLTENRLFAAEVISEIASPAFSGFLVELLDDTQPDVVNRAILAAGNSSDIRLINLLIDKLHSPGLRSTTGLALVQFGDSALFDLDEHFSSSTTNREVKYKIIDIICDINSKKSIEILLRHITVSCPQLRHQIYISLARLHYEAHRDDHYIFVNMLDQEVEMITWLLATTESLQHNSEYAQLHRALAYELDVHRDNMLLLTSFIFSSIAMLDSRANIDSKISELRVFALEVMDNLLTPEVKSIIIPLLDDLSASEQLQKLSRKFPQQTLTAAARFDEIISRHFAQAFFWTRATLLYEIGRTGKQQHINCIRSSLNDPEALVRETALWALAKLQPEDLQRTLRAHQDDPGKNVRIIVQSLLQNLQDVETPALIPATDAD